MADRLLVSGNEAEPGYQSSDEFIKITTPLRHDRARHLMDSSFGSYSDSLSPGYTHSPIHLPTLQRTPAQPSPQTQLPSRSQSEAHPVQRNASYTTALRNQSPRAGSTTPRTRVSTANDHKAPYTQYAMAPGLENGHAATANGHPTSTNGYQHHPQQPRRTLVLDLGDVLFHWSTKKLTALSPSTFHAVVLSPTWGLLECGKVSEQDAISAIAAELGLSCDSINEAIRQCKGTLRVDLELVESLMELKREMGDGLKVFAMTNIAKNDFVNLKETLQDWSLFDGEFTSFDVGMIKPELGFYAHVLKKAGVSDPSSAIFVDDKVVNVTAAQSFGMHGIIFESAPSLLRQLRNKLFDPIARGREYLRKNARNHFSQIENGAEIRDVFSQFLIHSELQDMSLISLSTASASEEETEAELSLAATSPKTWNYFIDQPVGTTATFPNDVDSTSYALLAFHPPPPTAHPILTTLLSNRPSPSTLIQTYLDPLRPRTCPVVLTNVLRAFYAYSQGSLVHPELSFVSAVLAHRGYEHGSAHYLGAEAFLYFLSCLVAAHSAAHSEIAALKAPLQAALRERVGRRDDAFAVAARVRACQNMGVWCGSDVRYLGEMQEGDGGWEVGWVCRFGRTRRRIGSRGVVSAFAVRALEVEREREGGKVVG